MYLNYIMELLAAIISLGFFLILIVEFIIKLFNADNSDLKKAEDIHSLKFIDLKMGYSTKLQYENYFIIVACLVFSIVTIEWKIKYVIFSAVFLGLIYLISIPGNKQFKFYNDYFEITSPFNIFFSNKRIKYENIKAYEIKRGMYNFHALVLTFKSDKKLKIEFKPAGYFDDELVVNLVLKEKINLGMDLSPHYD